MDVKNIIKTKILMIIVLLSLGTVKNLSAQPSFQGSGTEADPYRIYTLADMEELSHNMIYRLNSHLYYNKHYILMNDITDTLRVCIGYTGLPNNFNTQFARLRFSGVFNGNNFSINLGIDSCPPASGNSNSLFVFVDSGYVIKNLTVNGYVNEHSAVGASGIIGTALGNSQSKIFNCINNARITGSQIAGGVVAATHGHTNIDNCLNLGSITITATSGSSTPDWNTAGGIIGGVVGFSGDTLIIRHSKNSGFVNSNYNSGGILGGVWDNNTFNRELIIEGCINSNVVKGGLRAGCIVGNRKGIGTLINNHYDKQMCGEGE